MTHTPGHRGGVSEGFDLTRHMERTRLSQYPELQQQYDRATAAGRDAAWRQSSNPFLQQYQAGVDRAHQMATGPQYGGPLPGTNTGSVLTAGSEHALANAFSGRAPLYTAMQRGGVAGALADQYNRQRLISNALQNIRDRQVPIPSQQEIDERAAAAQAQLSAGAAERRSRPTYKKPLTPEQEARREKIRQKRERSDAIRRQRMGYGPRREPGESLYDYRQRTSPAAMQRQAYIDQFTGMQQQQRDLEQQQALYTGRSKYYMDEVKQYQAEYDAAAAELALPAVELAQKIDGWDKMKPEEQQAALNQEREKIRARMRGVRADMLRAHEFASSYEAGFKPEGEDEYRTPQQPTKPPPSPDTQATPQKPSGPAQTSDGSDMREWSPKGKKWARALGATEGRKVTDEQGRTVLVIRDKNGQLRVILEDSGKDVTADYGPKVGTDAPIVPGPSELPPEGMTMLPEGTGSYESELPPEGMTPDAAPLQRTATGAMYSPASQSVAPRRIQAPGATLTSQVAEAGGAVIVEALKGIDAKFKDHVERVMRSIIDSTPELLGGLAGASSPDLKKLAEAIEGIVKSSATIGTRR